MTKTTKSEPDHAAEVLAGTLASLEARIKALAKKKDATSVSMQVKLTRLYLQLVTEKRKHEAHEHRIASSLSLDLVVTWARGLETGERTQLVRALVQLDSKRSGLA